MSQIDEQSVERLRELRDDAQALTEFDMSSVVIAIEQVMTDNEIEIDDNESD